MEAIALGHDLGHTPFGHSGETALNTVHPEGFAHYRQSVRVVEVLEKNGDGLESYLGVKRRNPESPNQRSSVHFGGTGSPTFLIRSPMFIMIWTMHRGRNHYRE